MDLKRLKHLVALADERNFGRAAQRLHLSQPALSRSVQLAESELGLLLFDRSKTEINCTAAGSFVVERARKLLFDSHCLERDIGLFRDRGLGDIALGVGPFPACTLLPELLIELRLRYPAINTRVEVNNWQYLVEHLHSEELDFFVADVRDVPRDSDLTIVSIGHQHGRFYVRNAHPLPDNTPIHPTAIIPYGVASVRLPTELKTILRQALGLQAHEPLPLSVECDDVSVLKRVTDSSDTILASTDAAVREEVASGQLRALALVGMPPLYSEMGVVSLKGRSFSPMAQFAVEMLTRLAACLPSAKAH